MKHLITSFTVLCIALVLVGFTTYDAPSSDDLLGQPMDSQAGVVGECPYMKAQKEKGEATECPHKKAMKAKGDCPCQNGEACPCKADGECPCMKDGADCPCKNGEACPYKADGECPCMKDGEGCGRCGQNQ